MFPLLDLGFFAHQAEHFWRDRRWGHVDGIRIDPDLACCRGFYSVPGPLQSVQRAEMWGVILALQTSRAVHLGVDNLGVVRHVGRPLGGCRGPEPFDLVNDGDLLLLIDHMLRDSGVLTLSVFLRLRVMLMMAWFFMVRFVGRISWVMMLLMRLLILGVEGSVQLSLMSAVPFGPGIDIWRSCRFIGAMMRSLCMLPGGLGRFVPCSISANHCRLRHIGWEKCGHGLTSRPRESASELFLNELLSLFRYPPRSGRALLNGTLPLRYCAARFAYSTPTWRLPVSGRVSGLVAAYSDDAGDLGDEVVGLRVFRRSGSGPVRKRFRLNRKNSSTPCRVYGSISSTAMEEVASCGSFRFFIA